MRGCREHDVTVLHAFGHREVNANTEDFFAQKASLYPVLTRMHDNWIVIVDKESTQRRIEVVLLELTANIQDVQCPSTCGEQIWSGQL